MRARSEICNIGGQAGGWVGGMGGGSGGVILNLSTGTMAYCGFKDSYECLVHPPDFKDGTSEPTTYLIYPDRH